MPRDYQLYLNDIKNSCKKILKFTKNLDFNEFRQNELIYDAIIRNLEIIGEAAKTFRKKFDHNIQVLNGEKFRD